VAQSLGLADVAIAADATRALEIAGKVTQATDGALADLSFNCASLPGTEMATILSTRDDGEIYFFSMATDFSRRHAKRRKPVRMVMAMVTPAAELAAVLRKTLHYAFCAVASIQGPVCRTTERRKVHRNGSIHAGWETESLL
jgi:hypothetical protein